MLRRKLTAQIGGLACSCFDPRQRNAIFIHAVEVDQRLASHLVGPDPVVGDQLVSLSLSEFAIAATVLEFDEPASLVSSLSTMVPARASVNSATTWSRTAIFKQKASDPTANCCARWRTNLTDWERSA